MRQPHVVQVQVRRRKTTAHGFDLVPDGPPQPLKCNFRASLSGDAGSDGAVVTYSAYLLTTSPWPGGLLDESSQVVFRGKRYDMAGVPLERDGSRRTSHLQINLNYAGPSRG